MHNKMFMFSKTGGSSNVVVQSTANLNKHSGTRMWNSAVVLKGNAELYKRYLDYFNDLKTDKQDLHYYENHPSKPFGHLKIYHSPRGDGRNTFVGILDNVTCLPNPPTSGPATKVRVSTWQIKGANGRAIAQKLWQLDQAGCDVDIVATEIGSDKPNDPLQVLLQKPGPYNGPNVREFTENELGVHEKNLMIEGIYDSTPNQKIVFTGSMNFNNKSTTENDETMLRIDAAWVHDDFVRNFNDVRKAAFLHWQTS